MGALMGPGLSLKVQDSCLPWSPEPQTPMGASAEGQPHTEGFSPAGTSWAVRTSMGSPRPWVGGPASTHTQK